MAEGMIKLKCEEVVDVHLSIEEAVSLVGWLGSRRTPPADTLEVYVALMDELAGFGYEADAVDAHLKARALQDEFIANEVSKALTTKQRLAVGKVVVLLSSAPYQQGMTGSVVEYNPDAFVCCWRVKLDTGSTLWFRGSELAVIGG